MMLECVPLSPLFDVRFKASDRPTWLYSYGYTFMVIQLWLLTALYLAFLRFSVDAFFKILRKKNTRVCVN